MNSSARQVRPTDSTLLRLERGASMQGRYLESQVEVSPHLLFSNIRVYVLYTGCVLVTAVGMFNTVRFLHCTSEQASLTQGLLLSCSSTTGMSLLDEAQASQFGVLPNIINRWLLRLVVWILNTHEGFMLIQTLGGVLWKSVPCLKVKTNQPNLWKEYTCL